MLTGIAALTAGSLSMAIGEYGSVASQRDAELADLAIERAAIDEDPDTEVAELAAIYRGRGLSSDLAERVAVELHAVDALGAHARDELGLDPDALARPLEAALVSAASFAVGSLIPVLAITTTSTAVRSWLTVVVTLICLFALGAVGAELGGARRLPAAVRVMSLGAVTMAVTAGVGHLVGAHL
jgi:VIT1/CCC1 family predicted Fe2+/Mn2+ transporter